MYLGTVIASVIGYLLGSISFSIIIVFVKTKNDIRKHGSKNAGATNVARMLGKRWGIVIVLLDMLKVLVAALVAMGLNAIHNDLFNKTNFIIPAFFALVGHCYPIYYKFKGGKAVSCFLAVTLLANSMLFLMFFSLFLIIAMLSRKISPASIIGAAFIAGICFVPQLYGISSFEINGSIAFAEAYNHGWTWLNFANLAHRWSNARVILGNGATGYFYDSLLSFQICVVLSAVILIYKHKTNIKRLFQKSEPDFFTFNKEKRAEKRAERLRLRNELEENNKKEKQLHDEKKAPD